MVSSNVKHVLIILNELTCNSTCPLLWMSGWWGSTRVCVSSVTIVVVMIQLRPPIRELISEPEDDFSVCWGAVCSAASWLVAACSEGTSFSVCLEGTSLISCGECRAGVGGVETGKSSVASPFTRTNPSIWVGHTHRGQDYRDSLISGILLLYFSFLVRVTQTHGCHFYVSAGSLMLQLLLKHIFSNHFDLLLYFFPFVKFFLTNVFKNKYKILSLYYFV